MTPEEKALRDLWMSEMWKPVHEWHQTVDERIDAEVRNAALEVPKMSRSVA